MKRVAFYRIIYSIFSFVFVLSIFSACQAEAVDNSLPWHQITFRDIPGVTENEIRTIEELQRQVDSFTLNSPFSTELFIDENGETRGYIALLSHWLSTLFEIPFQPEIEQLAVIAQNLNTGQSSFASQIITEERQLNYFLSNPIAQRSVVIMRLPDSQSVSVISQLRLPRFVFLEGSMTSEMFIGTSEPGIIVSDYEEVYRILLNGEADAFLGSSTMEVGFDYYGGVVTEDFLPLTFIPLALATGNQDLKPIISIINKALQNGAYIYLTELYREGYQDYRKNRFLTFLTEEEREYVRNNPVIPFASQYMSYPLSFFNRHEQRWEGAVFDVLYEMERLTGLCFELVNDIDTELPELMNLLEDGTAFFIPNLVQSDERRERFIWPNTMYISDRFALLSKRNFPNIELNDIPFARVGFARGSAFADMFRSWFPNAINAVEYPNTDEAFLALNRGEVDLVMSTQSRLAALVNLYEFSDYKANFLFNAAFEASFGINRDQVIFSSIVDKALMLINTFRIMEQWESMTYDYEARLMREQRPWIIGTAATLALMLIILTIIYINDRKKRKTLDEQAARLTVTNNRIETIISNLPGMIFQHLYNPPEYTFTFVSEGCKELTGYTPEELVGNSSVKILSMTHPDDADHIEKLSAATLPFDLPFETTYRFTSRDGTIKWVWERSRVVQKNPDGSPYLIEGYYADITEQRQAKSRIETIMSNLPGMVYQCYNNHPEYTIAYVSEGSKELVGLTPEELIGGKNKFMEMVHPDDVEGMAKKTAETLNVGLPYEYTFRLIMKDGSIKWIWERSASLERNPDGTPYLIEGYMVDITEQRQYQAAELANRAKSAFLAKMSHEMRTPMNVVVGLTDLMLEEDDSSVNLKENLKKISSAGKNLLGLINDVLDISKIEAGKLELMPVKYEVPSLLNDIINLNVIRIEDKPITFKLDIKDDLPYSLYGDDLRVKQVINNLLSNAFKYTKQGTITLGLSCTHDSEGVWLYVYVSDTGVGIRKDDLNKLFTHYVQVDAHTNRAIEGTGLGLAITKQLVEMMDGEITAESEYGQGSVFRTHIRQGFVNNTNIGPDIAKNLQEFRYTDEKQNTRKKLVRPDLSYAKVLVVDDMQTNLDVAAGLLGKYKMQVDCVLSGEASVERIRSQNPVYDAIFMDHMMPGMDGIEAADAIRNLNSEYARKVPIIALTANAIQGTEKSFFAHGFQAFIPKPIDIMKLDSVIRKWIVKTIS